MYYSLNRYISRALSIYMFTSIFVMRIYHIYSCSDRKKILFSYIYKNIVLIFGKLFLKITINPHFMIINSIIYTKQTYHLYNIQPYRKTTKYQFLTMISTENKKIALLLLYITGIGLNNTLF